MLQIWKMFSMAFGAQLEIAINYGVFPDCLNLEIIFFFFFFHVSRNYASI